MKQELHDIIIIGGGPAGLTAGLYARRAGMETVLLERYLPGGQMLLTERIDNYPAFPDGVTGPELAERMKVQACGVGLVIEQDNVIEIKEPALDARLAGEAIAEQMKKRVAFRRAMKQQCELAMQAGAKGVKVICSGRLGGAEIARKETQMEGSIPLHTIDADIDYAQVGATTTDGVIGIKVWIYKGKYGTQLEELPGRKTLRKPRSRMYSREKGPSRNAPRQAQDEAQDGAAGSAGQGSAGKSE